MKLKKILSIFLAAIISICSTISVSAAPLTFDDCPKAPTQTKDTIYFYAEAIQGKPGETYEIPIYIISDYTPNCDATFVEFGLMLSATGKYTSATIEDISFSSDIKAMKGFKIIEEKSSFTEEEMNESYHSDFTSAYIACAVSPEILHQNKLKIATVKIKVSEYMWEDHDEDYVQVSPYGYIFTENTTGYWFDNPDETVKSNPTIGIYDTELDEAEFEANEQKTPAEVIYDYYYKYDEATAKNYLQGNIGYVNGFIIPHPPVIPWQDTLKEWFKKLINDILDFFNTIEEFIRIGIALI